MKLDANWSSPSPQPVSQRTLNLSDDMGAESMTLVLGRYLLVIGPNELRCYDLDSSDERSIGSYNLRSGYFSAVVDSSVYEREHAYELPLSVGCALLGSPERGMMTM
jgi:hypothetical protein